MNIVSATNLATLTFLCIYFLRICETATYNYEIKEFEVPLDHFNLADQKSFKIRYLYNNSFCKSTYSPLFIYTGNEGDIELFAQNTGLMWELGEEFDACIVFAEHRYYGKSLPFGENSFNSTENIAFLSVEQTLEDFASLIDFLWMGKQAPVIAFGGSYGGMLASWLRIKFPHLVYGALAASAPIWQFNGLTSCTLYSKIVTSVFNTSDPSFCTHNINRTWSTLETYSTNEDGRKQLNEIFKFCNPLKEQADIYTFLDYLEDVYGNLAMANYPYPSEFIAPLPSYPVRKFCFHLKDMHKGVELLSALQKAVNIYFNFTGNAKCLNYSSSYDQTLGGIAWDVQTCNEIVMPMCSYPNETMFRLKEWNFTDYSYNCFKKFKLKPELNEIVYRYGGKNIKFASNIIFSNGLLDPWSGGGVLHEINDEIAVIIIPEGAHHLDLRQSNILDPDSVKDARKREAKIIGQWIQSFFKINKKF